MDELIEYIEEGLSLSEDMKRDLKEISKVKHLEKGEMVLSEKSSRKIQIFVASGCLRAYHKTENGKDHTIQFAVKNWWISDYITLFTKQNSVLYIESLSHSKVFLLEQASLEKFYSKYPEFEVVLRKNLEKRVATLQKRILGLLTLTAKEKYQKFIEEYEVFERLIPNYQIASFLGITPESLSRVRKEISHS